MIIASCLPPLMGLSGESVGYEVPLLVNSLYKPLGGVSVLCRTWPASDSACLGLGWLSFKTRFWQSLSYSLVLSPSTLSESGMWRGFWEQPRRCCLIHPLCTVPSTTQQPKTWWWLGATTLWYECGDSMWMMWTASCCRSLRATTVSSTQFVLTLKVFYHLSPAARCKMRIIVLFQQRCPPLFIADVLFVIRKENVLRGQRGPHRCVENFSKRRHPASAMSSLVCREGTGRNISIVWSTS